ncbi:MAG: hypothetical protein LBI10_00615 [Deltaproteobacteria bacterium]|jgi:ABC-2 type transport system permease protein|nr:hypothetical protein [Deltaproteobacteria bacterium]
MREFLLLLKPSFLGFRNYLNNPAQGERVKFLSVGLFALALWVALFFLTLRTLRSFYSVEGFGDILAYKAFTLLWLTGAAFLMFSAIIASLSSFYLAKDLGLVMAAPVSRESVFWARSVLSFLASAWMPAAFIFPVFLAYGYHFNADFLYYALCPFAALGVALAAAFFCQILIIALVNVLPARRAKDIFGLVGLVSFVALYLVFRLIKPERLVNPDNLQSVASYLASLQTPTSPMLPTSWAADLLWPLLGGDQSDFQWIYLALLAIGAVVLALLASFAADLLYWAGYNKSQEGAGRQMAGGLLNAASRLFGLVRDSAARALMVKDFKIFFRDHTQWSQLFLLGALMVIYLYNFSVLNLKRYPLQAFFLENVIAFLNVGLVGLVSSTLALRFAFPSISAEGFSYWIVRSAPMSTGEFMRHKLVFWLVPIMVVALILTYLTNRFLNAIAIMSAVSFVLTLILTPGLCALAVGLGARYPRFDTENLAQVPTGYGGLVFMVSASVALLALIGLSVWPVVAYLRILRRAESFGAKEIILIPLMALLVLFLAWQLWRRPFRLGRAALEIYDEETRSLDDAAETETDAKTKNL